MFLAHFCQQLSFLTFKIRYISKWSYPWSPWGSDASICYFCLSSLIVTCFLVCFLICRERPMVEWLIFTYKNLSMLELWVCPSRENFSFDSERPYGMLSTQNYIRFVSQLGVSQVTQVVLIQTWTSWRQIYDDKFSQKTWFHLPSTMSKEKKVRSFVCSFYTTPTTLLIVSQMFAGPPVPWGYSPSHHLPFLTSHLARAQGLVSWAFIKTTFSMLA